MPTYTPQSSALTGLFYLRGLEFLHAGGDLAGVVRYLQAEVPGQLLFSFGAEATPVCPRWVCCNIGSKFFLLVDGSTTFQQVQNQIAGYLQSNGERNVQPYSLAITNACDSIIATLQTKTTGPIAFQYFAGYSFGGAIVEQYMSQLRFRGSDGPIAEVTSFGAPRVAGTEECTRCRTGTRIQRWMNDDDPVPLYPPRPQDYPPIAALIGFDSAVRFASFCHPTGGVSISQQGLPIAADVPEAATFSPIGGLANWLWSLDTGGSVAHSLDEYDRRMVLLSGVGRPGHEIPQGPVEMPVSTDRRQVSRAERATVQAIAAQAQVQNTPSVVIPTALDITAARVGRIWGVYFGDTQICTSGSKRAARATARAARAFLNELQHQAVVEPSALVQQLTIFLALASSPGSGFVPTMATTFPTVLSV